MGKPGALSAEVNASSLVRRTLRRRAREALVIVELATAMSASAPASACGSRLRPRLDASQCLGFLAARMYPPR